MQWRSAITIAAGMIVASGAAAALFALMSGDIKVYTLASLIIALVAIFLGMPAYFAARSARNDTPKMAAVMGFVVGAAIPAMLVLSGAPDQASVGDTATAVNGRYTLAGWVQNFTLVGLFGLLGTGAALLFWYFVHRDRGMDEEVADQPPSTARTAILSVAATSFIATAFAIPYATKDRSCHNPLRDGGSSIGQVAGFDLGVGLDEWRNVETEVMKFQRAGNWAVRSDVRIDEGFPWFQISLCREPGTNIFVQGQADFNQVSFGVYQPQGGKTWRSDFRSLYESINARWPKKVTFKDGEGRQTTAPEWAVVPVAN